MSGKINLDHQLYIIVKRHKLGFYSVERDVADMRRARTIEAIIGDPDDVASVIEFNAVEGISRDATSDIMAEIAQKAGDDGHPISPELYELISDHAGADYSAGLRTYDRSFAA